MATLPLWLSAWSDLVKDVRELKARLMLARDRDTRDEAAAQLYLEVREAADRLEPFEQRLRAKLLAADLSAPEGAELAVRRLKTDAALYHEANAALATDIEQILGKFGKLHAGLQLELDGETLGLHEAFPKQFLADRTLRERAFWAAEKAKASVSEEVDALALRLLDLRRRMAENVGLENYRAFDWQRSYRFDYTPEDALALHDAIAEEVVPLLAEVYAKKAARLRVEKLRPWDLLVDLDAAAPLEPFKSAADLEAGLQDLFSAIDPALGEAFAAMRPDWLDLESRPGKLPMVGYCLPFPASKRAFIYHRFFGNHADVWIMLHEGAHAFHMTAAARSQDLVWNRDPGGEFMELVSQAMELLGLAHLEKSGGGFYSQEGARQAEQEQLMRCLRLIGTAQVDAFHHWFYSQELRHVTAAELDAKWLELERRFNPWTDLTGLEGFVKKGWQSRSVLSRPFENLPYKIAMLGAIEVWRNFLKNPRDTSQAYRAALALGGSRSLPELFEAAGATFSFEKRHVRSLAGFLCTWLETGAD